MVSPVLPQGKLKRVILNKIIKNDASSLTQVTATLTKAVQITKYWVWGKFRALAQQTTSVRKLKPWRAKLQFFCAKLYSRQHGGHPEGLARHSFTLIIEYESN